MASDRGTAQAGEDIGRAEISARTDLRHCRVAFPENFAKTLFTRTLDGFPGVDYQGAANYASNGNVRKKSPDTIYWLKTRLRWSTQVNPHADVVEEYEIEDYKPPEPIAQRPQQNRRRMDDEEID